MPGAAVGGYSKGNGQLIPAVLLKQMPAALLRVSPLVVHIDFSILLGRNTEAQYCSHLKLRGPRPFKC